MKYTSIETLDVISDLLMNGQWEDAIKMYKAININARDFSLWIDEQPIDIIDDFALLGFYSREFTPDNTKEY